MDTVYEQFLDLADSKKDVTDEDLDALVSQGHTKQERSIKLEKLQVVSGLSLIPTATVTMSFDGDVFTETATGNGPVDAVFTAIKALMKRKVHLEEYLVQAVTRGSDDLGKA